MPNPLSKRILNLTPRMKSRVTFSLETELLKRIDKARGDVPRSVYIQRMIEREMK